MIPYGKHYVDADDIKAVVEVLRNGHLTQGPVVGRFEEEIAKYVGAKYAVAVSSGTAGLHLAALAVGVGPGDVVVTSPITFVASANAALLAGGKPVFADIDPLTVNISPDEIEKVVSLNSSVKAIVPVHFAGLPCNMPDIALIAENVGAAVIEDAAHALGGTYPDGKRIGCCAHSLMTVFSLHPVKAIAAGEGGVITTNDKVIYRRLLRLRSHGINKLDDPFLLPEQAGNGDVYDPWYYEMQELGLNYRITDIQCALGLSQLSKLDEFIAQRRRLVKQYDERFCSMKNISPMQNVGRDLSAHHLYVLSVDFKSIQMDRARFIHRLKERNVGSQVHYIPVPSHPYYRSLGYSPHEFPRALDYYEYALSIPLFYELTNEQQDYIVCEIAKLAGELE